MVETEKVVEPEALQYLRISQMPLRLCPHQTQTGL